MKSIKNEHTVPKKGPDHGILSKEEMRKMEPADLAEALEAALSFETEETYDPELIAAYLEVLDEKAPMSETPDPEGAYQRFQKRVQGLTMLNTKTDNGGNAPLSKERKPLYFRVRRAVAVLAAVFVLVIGARAAGMNVFGYLAQWTDDVFTFIVPTPARSEYYAPFRDALMEHEIPSELAPSWYPAGFRSEGPVYKGDNPFCDSVYMRFTHDDGREFIVSVKQYFSLEDVVGVVFEKDAANVELYASGERTFYILSNQDTVTAVWADGLLSESIKGNLSVDKVKSIIDSIGG